MPALYPFRVRSNALLAAMRALGNRSRLNDVVNCQAHSAGGRTPGRQSEGFDSPGRLTEKNVTGRATKQRTANQREQHGKGREPKSPPNPTRQFLLTAHVLGTGG